MKYTMPQFVDALRKLGNHVRGPVLAKAALAGAAVIETHAKINVSNTFTARSGNLGNSIISTLEESSSDRARVAVGPTVIYGRIHELGGVIKPVTAKRLHWVDEGGNHHTAMAVTMPARPYLRPAIDNNKSSIWNAIAANLQIEIEGQI